MRPQPLDEQIGAYMEESRQFFRLSFADGTPAVEHLGSNSFRPKNLPKVLLRQATGFHQMMKRLARAGLAYRIATRFILVNQDGQEFSQLLFFAGSALVFVKTEQFAGEALAFLVRADDMGQCPAQQLPVCFLVEIDSRSAHGFQSPRSYSACVRRYKTKTRWVS